MIYTCTLNPAIDYRIRTDHLSLGSLNRFHEATFKAGGKGINVSIVLSKFGIESIATGFLGGFTGAFIASELTQYPQIQHRFIKVKDNTRINVKIMNQGVETELNPVGPKISESEIEELLQQIDQLGKNDILICGGSSAVGYPDLYEKIAKHCQNNQIQFIMDTPGHDLSQFISYRPFLIKPNIHELEAYFETSISTLPMMIHYGQRLIMQGAEHVLLSMGAKGSILLTQDHIYRASLVSGHIKSTVGAGDSMVAGFVAGFLKTQDVKQAYQYAVACASASIYGNELGDPSLFNEIIRSISIEEIHDIDHKEGFFRE
jgi:1-phosphofructokinase